MPESHATHEHAVGKERRGWRAQRPARRKRGLAGGAVRGLRGRDAGLRQPQHAYCGGLYRVFGQARALVRPIEFHLTSKHRNWLNTAENKLGALTRQCLQRRRPAELAELREGLGAWAMDVNSRQRGVDWQMTIASPLRLNRPVRIPEQLRGISPGRLSTTVPADVIFEQWRITASDSPGPRPIGEIRSCDAIRFYCQRSEAGMARNPRQDRRQFLRGTGYALALPLLPSLPGAARTDGSTSGAKAKRLVCVGTQLGFYKPEFFASGETPRLMQPLADAGLSGHYTTVSGLDHKGPTGNGHGLVYTLYTGHVVPSISLDQYVAPTLGSDTRYESLQLCCGEAQQKASLAFTQSGVPLPVTLRPSALYAMVFGAGSVELQRQTYLIDSGKSLLDELTGAAKIVSGRASASDRRKLDEYLTSVRAVEGRLQRRRAWLDKPFPEAPVDLELPVEENTDGSFLLDNEDLMWDLMALAIQNDSTRVISLTVPITDRALFVDGKFMSEGYHRLSHHGNKKEKIDGLLTVEQRHMRGAARFLKALHDTEDADGGTMLDSTITLIGSAMGDAAAHRRTNYPLLVAGGGLKHKRHVSCGEGAVTNTMACDLYVTVLQQLGFEVGQFSTSESDLNNVLT